MKRQSIILYILIFLVLAGTAGMIFLSDFYSAPDTAAVILPTAPPDGGKDDDSNAENAPQVVEIKADTVQAALRTLSRADSYSRTLCVDSFWEGGESRRNIDVWVNGSSARLDISRTDGSSTMHLLIDGDEKWLWYSGFYGSYHGVAAESEADRWQGLLSYEHILELDSDNITEAGYTDFQGEMCIYVRYISGELGYENVCYVSTVSGLVMGEESYSAGTLTYRMSSTAPSLAIPEEDIFEHP